MADDYATWRPQAESDWTSDDIERLRMENAQQKQLLADQHIMLNQLQPIAAAATDLLEACREVLRDVERANKNNVVWPSTVKQIKAAIKKASE
jgi:hypothetical protein